METRAERKAYLMKYEKEVLVEMILETESTPLLRDPSLPAGIRIPGSRILPYEGSDTYTWKVK